MTALVRTPAVAVDGGWRFPLLARGLAAALVLDQLWWGGFEVASWHGLVVLAAAAVLARPRSVVCFAALLGAEVVAVGRDMPFVGSHRVLLLVVAAAALGHLAVTTLRTRRLPDAAALAADLTPLLRAALVVVYAASALAKLNTAFLDPATSCATGMARGVVWFDPAVLDAAWVGPVAVGGTVLVEATLPVLLLVRRTRVAGLVLGAVFHVVLALAGNVPFSAVCLALDVAFLPADTADRLRAVLPRRPDRAHPPVGGPVAAVLLVAGWLAGSLVGPVDPSPGLLGRPSGLVSPTVGAAARLVVVAVALVGVGLLLLSRVRVVGPAPEAPPARRHAVLVLGAAVLVANALCPYLGLKTDTSLEMFSGLRTEPGAWNQLLVPERVRVFDAQEPVQVTASTDPGLVARTAGGARTTLTELDRALRSRPGSTALYRTADDPTPRPRGPLPAGPTVGEWSSVFRDLPPPGVPRC